VTGYEIHVLTSDGTTYAQETTPADCDGTSSAVVSGRTCTISLVTLKASPFSLVKDDSVTVKVISQNVYGDSALSTAGSGAVI